MLSVMVVGPAIKYVKKAMATMCEHIEKDARIFQSEVARKGAQDKGNYELLFKGISGISASQNERDAYRRMHTQISEIESALDGAERHDTRQMVSDVLQLALKFRSCTDAFTNLVSMIASGVPGVEWKQRQGFKAFFRMIEKGIMKGSAKTAGWKAALSLDSPVDCSKILDGVACIYFCTDFVAMEVLIRNLVAVIANKDNDNVRICWIKNRWEQHKTAGGWRDCMINLVVDGVVMEIQIAHEKLYFYREEWGHSTYGDIRCYEEMLALTGNVVKDDCAAEAAVAAAAGHSVNEQPPAYDVIFSHTADQLPFIEELIEHLPGLRCFSQKDLDRTQASRKLRWFEAFQGAPVCVCVLTKEYLLSGPCCLEWNTATITSEKRIVIVIGSPDGIVGSVNQSGSLCDTNVDIYLHLRDNKPVFLKSSKTVPELCAAIKHRLLQLRQVQQRPIHTVGTAEGNGNTDAADAHNSAGTAGTDDGGGSVPAESAAVGGGGASIFAATVGVAASVTPPVDILVIVDFPARSSGGAAFEPAKYVAPLQALKDALDETFVGTKARIRFHTPRSIVENDRALLKHRLQCLCWIAIGEEAPSGGASLFTASLWKELGGSCEFAAILMKHGAESCANKLLAVGCADRVLWIAADYTSPTAHGFLANRASNTAAIPDVLRNALTGVRFDSKQTGAVCCSPALDLVRTSGIQAGLTVKEGSGSMLRVTLGQERLLDDAGISLSRTPSDPVRLTEHVVGVPKHANVDLSQWPAVCELLRQLNEGSENMRAVIVAGRTEFERKNVAWTALQSYAAVANRFDVVVYRDSDAHTSSWQNARTFDLPFEAYGGQNALVWMDSRSSFPLEALREAIDAHVKEVGTPLPWTFILTAQEGLDDVGGTFLHEARTIVLPEADGTTVNESSEDLIRLTPADSTLPFKNILEVVDADQLLNILAAVLPQSHATAASAAAVASGGGGSTSIASSRDYLHQILVGNGNSVVVRGMVPNTSFLFELRNALVGGSLERTINASLQDYVGDSNALGGQRWKVDTIAFARIYSNLLSQMNQLSPHQRAKLQECETANHVHISGPAGCGKTFLALHMVIDLIEAAEMALGPLSREAPLLFVGKNEALCLFFINWIKQRLCKTNKTGVALSLVATYIQVLHTSPFEDQTFGVTFSSDGMVKLVARKASAKYSLVIVDEAHHIFAAANDAPDDPKRIATLCANADQSVLLSDISQSGSAGDVNFPPHVQKDVVLMEVVRNSSRIFAASLPFCRSADLSDVGCSHGVRGPPLIPFMFDHCMGDENARFTRYVDGIVHGLNHIHNEFPGAEVHDNTVILVPSATFKEALLPRLNKAMQTLVPMPGISIVDAVEGAFPEPKSKCSNPSRIVFDTLEAFDGMERLFVLAVGLDSVRTIDGCCNMYRAITRAHMFVCVVQEHLKGGWLEFMGTVQRDEQVDFDEAEERRRVSRENLAVIESLRIAEVKHVDLDVGCPGRDDDSSNYAANDAVTEPVGVEADIGAEVDVFDADDDLRVVDTDAHVQTDVRVSLHAQFDPDDVVDADVQRPTPILNQEQALVRIQSVWEVNINADDFTATISTLSFDPLATDGGGATKEQNQAQQLDAVEETGTLSTPEINIESMKVVQLRSELQSRGLETKGKKATLQQRLQEALSNTALAKGNLNDKAYPETTSYATTLFVQHMCNTAH